MFYLLNKLTIAKLDKRLEQRNSLPIIITTEESIQ